MNKVKISLFALAALFAVSCVQDPVMENIPNETHNSVAKKIINSSESAVAGKLILYVSEETADAFMNAETATRSGIESFDAVAMELGAESIEPVFNMNINGDEKRAQNLHRWFVVNFDSEADVEQVAEKFASVAGVNRVQYATKLARPSVKVFPADVPPATRASDDMPFSDVGLKLQWHYNNKGLQSTYKTSVENEDINLFAAWEYATGSPEIIVAVVDEGVKYTHEDLIANMWINTDEVEGNGKDDDNNGVIDDIHGYNSVNGTGNITWDKGEFVTNPDGITEWVGDSGHGTHVAGTVAAVNGNGIGVAGVAGGATGNGDGVKIMSIQIFDGTTQSSIDRNAKGIEYAADNGASVLQNSWGYPLRDGRVMTDGSYEISHSLELAALRYFVSKSNCPAMDGNVVIFAAGNDAQATAHYPGAYNEFIAVTAYGADGLPTSYTNYNFGCNVAAPGGDYDIVNNGTAYNFGGCVYSTLPGETIDVATGQPYGSEYGYMQGTSMACPHVSGIAALVLSYALDNGIHLTNTQLYDILTSSVRNIDDVLVGTKQLFPSYSKYGSMTLDSYKGKMGTGKIDALMAIMNVRGAQCVPATVGKEAEIKITNFIGNGDIKVKAFKDFKISDETKERLGIDNVDFFSTSVYLTCKKPGIGVITVKYIAGGDAVGGGETTGGKLMEKDIVIISREANDNDGWL